MESRLPGWDYEKERPVYASRPSEERPRSSKKPKPKVSVKVRAIPQHESMMRKLVASEPLEKDMRTLARGLEEWEKGCGTMFRATHGLNYNWAMHVPSHSSLAWIKDLWPGARIRKANDTKKYFVECSETEGKNALKALKWILDKNEPFWLRRSLPTCYGKNNKNATASRYGATPSKKRKTPVTVVTPPGIKRITSLNHTRGGTNVDLEASLDLNDSSIWTSISSNDTTPSALVTTNNDLRNLATEFDKVDTFCATAGLSDKQKAKKSTIIDLSLSSGSDGEGGQPRNMSCSLSFDSSSHASCPETPTPNNRLHLVETPSVMGFQPQGTRLASRRTTTGPGLISSNFEQEEKEVVATPPEVAHINKAEPTPTCQENQHQLQIQSKDATITKLQAEIDSRKRAAEKSKQSYEQNIIELVEKNEKLSEETKQTIRKKEQLSDELDTTKMGFSHLLSNAKELGEKLEHLKVERKTISDENIKLKEKISSAPKEKERLQFQVLSMQGEINSREEIIAQRDSLIDSLKIENAGVKLAAEESKESYEQKIYKLVQKNLKLSEEAKQTSLKKKQIAEELRQIKASGKTMSMFPAEENKPLRPESQNDLVSKIREESRQTKPEKERPRKGRGHKASSVLAVLENLKDQTCNPSNHDSSYRGADSLDHSENSHIASHSSDNDSDYTEREDAASRNTKKTGGKNRSSQNRGIDPSIRTKTTKNSGFSNKGTNRGGGSIRTGEGKLRAALGKTILKENPGVQWDDVAGLTAAKESLKETVLLPARFPQLFTGKRRPFKGILLYGPPGTGKTRLANAVATEADSTFLSVSSADLLSKWLGESERLVRNLFELAREQSPAVVFIDEVDSLCGSRAEGEDDSARRIKTEFLVQMDGVGKKNDEVLVLGATNLPWELDCAIRRRFEKRVYIPLPNQEARSFMVKLHVGDTPNNLSEQDFDTLGRLTEGASGSDIKVLVKEALMEPLRRCQQAKQFLPVGKFLLPCEEHPACAHCPSQMSKDYNCPKCGAKRMQVWDVPPEKLKVPEICLKDFESVMRHAFSSVSKLELEKFTTWTKHFGQDGA